MPGRIEDYALIGDMQTAALVCRDGSIDWLCFPRFDSPACFAALLGSENNGRWLIAPQAGGTAARRRYRGDSLILETEWDTEDGTVRVIDFMPPRGEAPDIVRIVEGVSGRVPVRCELRLRFDYGRVIPWVRRIGGDLGAIAGPDAMWLRTPVDLHGEDFTTLGEFTVAAGERVPFVLTWHPSHLPAPTPVDPEHALIDTEELWREWVKTCGYEGEWRDAVVRSLITLKALTYAPTGGVVAAPTTSLPEDLGGERNWDYRYCWLRDATITLEALLHGGFVEEAKAWREWLLRAVAGTAEDLQIMYGVAGERRLQEWEADWLSGYENSRPVRIGNAAVDQLQLDVYGEVIDAMYLSLRAGAPPNDNAWSIQAQLMEFLEGHWREPDEGIWEVRGPRRHFVHSKVMAWVAADRVVHMIEDYGRPGESPRWRALREEIHREVCEKGYDAERNTFTQSYGKPHLDAALLLIPRVGFLPPTDPRVIGTVEAIERELMVDGFLLRYRTDKAVDPLAGDEGAFLACSFWLADALHMTGRHAEGRALFERLLELRNDVGLLSEEYDPRHRRLVGNMPQAFSHVPLVRTAHNLSGRHELSHHPHD
ncbi:MAG: glycoside hydrolase family 15 protein [Streptosporangiales bacterium]|nr:glycoside hydrolase family 15 protein [Streptosporangiales bacterium]